MTLQMIVATLEVLEVKTFAQLKVLVDKMKVIVTLMMIVRILLSVDHTNVQTHLILLLMLIVVGMKVFVGFLRILETLIVMMKTIMRNVDGMAEIVVVMM